MSPSPASVANANSASDFRGMAAQMAVLPLHEVGPAGPGAAVAALGFALGLAATWAAPAGLVWAGEETVFAEEGAPYPPGLAAFGLDPARLIVVRAKKRDEALWAAEQALGAGALVICALGASRKPLELKASRRLLLFAEKHNTRCLLLKQADGASAAWTRWSVAPAPSRAHDLELGAPAYEATLARRRAGPAGARFILEWNAHDRAFAERFQENREPVFRQEAQP